MKNIKKIIAITLAIAIIFSVVPFSAGAVENQPEFFASMVDSTAVENNVIKLNSSGTTTVVAEFGLKNNPTFAAAELLFSAPEGWEIFTIGNGSKVFIDYQYENNGDTQYSIVGTYYSEYGYYSQPKGWQVNADYDGSGKGYLYFLTDTGENFTKDGSICWITYVIPADTQNGEYEIGIESKHINTVEQTGTDIGERFIYTPAVVTVTGGATPVADTVTVTAPEVTTISVPLKGAANNTVQLSASVMNETGGRMPDAEVTWSVVGNPSGVSVDGTGLVTVDNTAAAGDVTVQASCNGKTGTATLTLTKEPRVVTTVEADDKTVDVPAAIDSPRTVKLTAKVYDQYGLELSGKNISWSSAESMPDGVEVMLAQGKLSVSSNATPGVGSIEVSCEGASDIAYITFRKAASTPTAVTIYKDDAEVTMDSITIPQTGSNTASYSAVVTDQYGATMENQTINWTLTPAGKGLSVNANNGDVTAEANAEPGTYTLTATCGSASATMTITAAQIQFTVGDGAITVAEKPTYGATWGQIVSVNNSKITAKVGEDTVTGTYSVKDADQRPDAGEQTYTIVFNNDDYTNVTVTTGQVEIARKTVKVTGGITAADKEYDGNTSAILSGSAATFNGLLDGDELTVSAVTGAFQDKTVDENKTVNINKITLGGADAANYTLADNDNQSATTATITAKRVTITGVDAQDKPYDGGTTATAIGTASLNGLVLGDNVTITTGTAAFESKNVGTWDVTFSGYGITGSDADNYLLTAQPASVQATISPKSVTITGTTVRDKTYDGTKTATISNPGSVEGTISTDVVNVRAGTATFASADVGTDIAVTFSGFSLTGAGAGNYELSQQPANATADITKANYPGSASYNVNVLTNQATPARGTISVDAFFQDVPADATITKVEADSTGNDIMASVTAANGTITYESNTNLATAKKKDTYDVTISTRNYNNITATLTFTTVDKTPVIVSGVAVAGKTYDGKTVSYTGTPVAKKADGSTVAVTGFTYTWMKDSVALNGAPKDAGSYKLRVAVAETDPAYTGYVDLSFTISKATITITAQNASVTVNSSMPKLSYQVTGLAAGEKLATEPTLTCNAKLNQIGSYPIVPSGAAVPNTDNYNETIVYKNGTLSVVSNEKPQVTVTGGAHGFATISDPDAKEGDVVAITVTCDPGYEVDEVTVTTLSGKPVRVVKTGGKHTFVMPAEKVKIQVTYQEIQEVAYTDVVVGSWYEEAVAYVSDNGIMNGVGGGKFAPNRAVTRAMVWTVLARMDGEDTASTSLWYAKAQQWAMETGVSDGTTPESAITREQLATMLYRYYGSPAVSGSLSGYVDGASVSDWAKDAMVWAVQEGLIQGTGANKLSPTAATTRAQLAQILMRLDLKF